MPGCSGAPASSATSASLTTRTAGLAADAPHDPANRPRDRRAGRRRRCPDRSPPARCRVRRSPRPSRRAAPSRPRARRPPAGWRRRHARSAITVALRRSRAGTPSWCRRHRSEDVNHGRCRHGSLRSAATRCSAPSSSVTSGGCAALTLAVHTVTFVRFYESSRRYTGARDHVATLLLLRVCGAAVARHARRADPSSSEAGCQPTKSARCGCCAPR